MAFTLPENAQELETGGDVVQFLNQRERTGIVVAYCFSGGTIVERRSFLDANSFLAVIRGELREFTLVRFFIEQSVA